MPTAPGEALASRTGPRNINVDAEIYYNYTTSTAFYAIPLDAIAAQKEACEE